MDVYWLTTAVVTLFGCGVLCLVPAAGGTGGNARVLTGGFRSWTPPALLALVTAGVVGLSAWWLCRTMIGY